MTETKTRDGSFASDLRVLLESGDGADVTLVAGDSEMPAHSFILAARSPVFAATLRNDMKEARSRRIEITDVQSAVLEQLLWFIYTDTAPKLESVATELLACADKYDLPLLKNMCEEKMSQCLTVDNAAATAVFALQHSGPLLKSAAVEFIARHLEVMTTDGWISAMRSNAEATAQICSLVAEATPKSSSPQQPLARSDTETRDLAERLTQAAECSKVDELRRLLAAGAPVDAKDSSGSSALHLAVRFSTEEVVKCLLEAGADVEAKDSCQQTALHTAAARGNAKIVLALLSASPKLDVQDRWGKTPLHWAAAMNNEHAVKLLLIAGAKDSVYDAASLTAQETAPYDSIRELF